MSNYKIEYIKYRVEKSAQAYEDAKILAANGRWNGAVNRLYYSCYYIVSALALNNDIVTQTHSGLKTQFNLNFIKTEMLSKDLGKLYSDLFDWRQKGDYGDMYDFDKETVESLLMPVEEFLKTISSLIKFE